MSFNFRSINYMPTKEMKDRAFTVRFTSKQHARLLCAALLAGESRAVTAEDLIIEALDALGIPKNEHGLDEFMRKHGVDPDTSSIAS